MSINYTKTLQEGKVKMTIAWGEHPCEDQIVTYTFDTGKEADAFLKGVEEGNGWLDYAVIGDDVKDEQGNIIMHTSYDGDLDDYITAVEEGRA